MKIANKMFRKGRSIVEIKELTELSDDTIRELKREYDKTRDMPER